MLYQQHVEAVVVCGQNKRLKQAVGLFGGGFLGDQPQALAHPLNVGIDWHSWQPEREQQDAGGGFRADPGQGAEPRACLFERHFAQELKVPAGRPFAHGAQDGLDARRLLGREPPALNRGDQLRRRRGSDRLPGRVPAHHLDERATAVRVGRVLRKHGEHEFGHRVPMRYVLGIAVERGQAVHNHAGCEGHQSFSIRAAMCGRSGILAASRAYVDSPRCTAKKAFQRNGVCALANIHGRAARRSIP